MRALRFPHPLALLTACILLAAAASHVVPAGEYQRRDDPATGRQIVVAGTYHRVSPQPVGPFQALVAIPMGMANAGSVIFLVFLVGGAFTVVDRTGALRHAVHWLVGRLQHRLRLVVPFVCIAFATAGALENMAEEIIALIPVLLLLTGGLGMDALAAVAMSLGAAAVGAAFSPINPFQVGIAQKLADLPLLSGSVYRLVFLGVAVALWIWGVLRYTVRNRLTPTDQPGVGHSRLGLRQGLVLALVLGTFGVFIYGVMRLGWNFDQMSALFLLLGVAVGIVGGLRIAGTADAFVEGFRSMAYAGLLIGFARAIYVVLDEGRIVDTLVHALFTPLGKFPIGLSAAGMMAAQTVVHVPVPSVSGQAVLTMPLLVPLSDLLGLARQVTVLAYQYGGGLCELITPTNGALMAIVAAAGVPYERWLRFAVPMYVLLFGLGLLSVGLAIAIGLG